MHDAPILSLDATGLRVGLVTSLYHEGVTSRLREGAISAFVEAGGDPDDLYEVVAAGAFELIPLADALARKDLDAVVVLGCVDLLLCRAMPPRTAAARLTHSCRT